MWYCILTTGFWCGSCFFRYGEGEQWGRGVCVSRFVLGKAGGNTSIWRSLPQITFTELPLRMLLRKLCLLGYLGFWQNCTKGNCSIISWWLPNTLDPRLLEFASRSGLPREKSDLPCLLRSQCTKSGPNLISGRNHYQSIIKIAFLALIIKLLLYVFSFSLFPFIQRSMQYDFIWGDVERERDLYSSWYRGSQQIKERLLPKSNTVSRGVYWSGLRLVVHSRGSATVEVIHEKP